MKTNTIIEMSLIDLLAKGDCTIGNTSLQSEYSKANELIDDTITKLPYATLEPNYFILDGNNPILSTIINTGFCSSIMSRITLEQDMYKFADEQFIEFNFNENHTCNGITLDFGNGISDLEEVYNQYGGTQRGNLPKNITVVYYENVDDIEPIENNNYDIPINTINFFAPTTNIVTFKKIKIVINGLYGSLRYAKIRNIEFGQILKITDKNIISANLIKESSIISSELPIDTLELELYDDNFLYNILNENGIYKLLQENQKLTVKEIINDTVVDLGKYYLKSWENIDEKSLKLKAVDLAGILDNINYIGFDNNWTGFINTITLTTGLSPETFKITNSANNRLIAKVQVVSIPSGSCRSALMNFAFCAGLIIKKAKKGPEEIILDVLSNTISQTIDYSQKVYETEKLVQNADVSSVVLSSHNFVINPNEPNYYPLLRQTLDVGEYTIQHDMPTVAVHYANCTSESPWITKWATVINVPTYSDNVVISGWRLLDIIQKYYIDITTNNVNKNEIIIDKVYSIQDYLVPTLSPILADYYSRKYTLEVEVINVICEPLDKIIINSYLDKKIVGHIEKVEIDLVGFTSKITLKGDLYS